MKRKFTLLIAALALLTMIVQPGRAWGQTTVTYRQTSTSAVSVNSGTAPTGSTASFSTTYTNMNQLTSGNSMTLTLSGYDGQKITAITLSMKSNSSKGGGSLSVVAGTTTIASIADSKFNTSNWYGAWSTSYVDVNVTMTDNSYEIQEDEDVVITITASENSLYCQSFTLTYEDASGTLIPCNLALTDAPIALEFDLYNNSTAQVINYTTSSTGEVTINGGTGYVTTVIDQVNKTITVTPVAVTPSAQTITVSQAAYNTYAAGSTTFTVNITDSTPPTGGDVTFVCGTDVSETMTLSKNGVSMTFESSGGTWSRTDNYRLYANKSLTISTTSGSITSVVFTISQNNFTGAGYNNTTNTWSGNATTLTLSADGGQVRFTPVVVTVETGSTSLSVTYNGNGNTGGDVPTDSNEYENGDEVTVLGNTGELVKAGYIWSGWNTKADGTGIDRAAGSTFAISENTTLYAKWTEKTITSLTYTGTPTEPQYAGQAFNPEGLTVTASFNDASQEDVTSQVVWTPNPLTIETTSVTGTYMGLSINVEGITVTYAPGTQNNPYTVAQARAAIDAGTGTQGVYATGIVCTASPQLYNGGKLSYYISADGLTTSDQLEAYNGLGINGEPFTSVDDVQVGDIVVIYGNLTKYNSTYEFAANNRLYSLVRKNITVDPTSINLSYITGNGPDETDLTITGTGLTQSFTATIAQEGSYFEMTDGTNTGTSLTIPAEGDLITVRLKAGLSHGDYTGTLTMHSEELSNDVVVALTGSVTNQTYDIVVTQPATGGTIAADKEYAEAGATVTLTANPEDAYNFGSWSVVKDDFVTPVTVTNNQFTMPACDVLVTATFTAKPTYAITTVVNPANSGIIVTDNSAWEGKTVEVQVEAATGYVFLGLVVSKTGDASTTITTSGDATNGFTFTMPAYAVTATATFISNTYDGTFEPFTGDIVEGDYVIYGGTNGAMKNTITSNRFDNQSVSFNESNISNPNIAAVWHIAQISGTDFWSIYNVAADKYAGGTNSKNQGALYDDTEDDLAKWTIEYDNGYTFKNYGRTLASSNSENAYLRQNGSSGWATYIVSTGNAPQLYKLKQPVAPTWSDQFPTEANLITGQEYELTVSDYVSGYPTPTITLVTDASTDDYDFDDGLLVYTPSATGTFTFTFTATNAAGSSDGVLTITVTEPAPVNYYYSENGVLGEPQSTTQGSSITLADAEDLNEDFVFVGWTTNASDVENILDAGSQQTIDAETTFYAVYSNTVSVTETKVAILDGEAEDLPSTAQELTFSENGFTYYSNSVKYQALGSNPNNNISNGKVLLIGKKDKYLYNTTAFGDGITKFEVYANAGAAAAATAGVYFSTSTIEAYETGENTWESDSEGMGTDNLYDASSYLPSGAKYFWYQVTNDKNTQVQFRITYTETSVVTTKYTLVKEYSGEQEIATVTPTDLITVPSGAVLTITGDCTGTAANLIIEDGGQLIVSNSGVQATFKKSVSHSAAKDANNWYTISSPVNNITPSAVTNLIQTPADNYDLYYYDEENVMWKNHKKAAITNLTNGKGYLYWNAGGDELSFPGELNSGNIEIALTKTGTGDLAGWNLIGNPYSHNIYKGAGTAIVNSVSEGYELTTGFYTLANSGAWVPGTDNTTAIVPGQGILVKATTAGTLTMTNTNSSGTAKANNDNIQFLVSNSEYEDITYALFNTGIGLDKINHRNADIPMIYIPQDGQNYAIATMDDNTQAFELNFKAMTTGQYTLSYKAEGKYSYLHVIDRLTGEDIDMLLDGEYSFIGSPRDNEARFIVKLSYNANIDEIEVNDNFAYQNGSDIIVNGNGELQVFDVTGRMVMNTKINGIQTVNVPATGMYIFRMVGESVQTQKIVVR